MVSPRGTFMSRQRRISRLTWPRFLPEYFTKQGWKRSPSWPGPKSRLWVLLSGFLQVDLAEQVQLAEQEAPHLGQVQLALLQLFVQVQLLDVASWGLSLTYSCLLAASVRDGVEGIGKLTSVTSFAPRREGGEGRLCEVESSMDDPERL